MRSEVCATLAAVFPLVLIAVVTQRSMIHMNLRRSRIYRRSVQVAIVASLTGLVLVVIGQQIGALPVPLAIWAWILFGADVSALGLTVMVTAVTSELEEEPPPPGT